VTADRFRREHRVRHPVGLQRQPRGFRARLQSTDQGDNWTNISGNLPNMPVNDLEVDNSIRCVSTWAPTSASTPRQNGGATWYPLGQGMPFQAVHDIYLHTAGRTLFAGTHGRSMWKLDLTQMRSRSSRRRGRQAGALGAEPEPEPRQRELHALALGDDRAQVSVFDAQGRLVRSIHSDRSPPDGTRSRGTAATPRAARRGPHVLREGRHPGGVKSQRLVRAE